MTKTKEKSELEYLRGLVKSMRSQVKHLKKELSRKQKREYLHEDLEEKEAELLLEEEIREREHAIENKCPDCGKGKLEFTDLNIRTLITCPSCGYKKIIKNNGKK